MPAEGLVMIMMMAVKCCVEKLRRQVPLTWHRGRWSLDGWTRTRMIMAMMVMMMLTDRYIPWVMLKFVCPKEAFNWCVVTKWYLANTNFPTIGHRSNISWADVDGGQVVGRQHRADVRSRWNQMKWEAASVVPWKPGGLPVGSPLHLKRVAIIMCNCAWHMKIATSTINAYNLHHHLHADQVRWQWQSKDFHRQFQITINHPCHYRIVMLWRFCVEKEGWEVSSWENEAEEVVHYFYYFYCYYYDYYTIQCLSLIWRIQVGMGVRERVFFS